MSGDQIAGIVALAAMLILAVNGLNNQGAKRVELIRMMILWLCIAAVIGLVLWIISHYGHNDLT